jgi:hypothetical protein
MPETTGSLTPGAFRPLARRFAVAVAFVLSFTIAASAQQPDQPVATPIPEQPDFLSRADFQLSASGIVGIDDIRYAWDTHFGGSVDIVDYVRGRAGVYADYQAVLGDEFRIFDPNQGNYTLEAFATARVSSTTEIMGMFHHVSRHLSDRPKRFAIAWNVAGVRLLHQAKLGTATLDIDVEGGKVTQYSYADYTWIGELHVQVRRPINERVAAFGRVAGQWVGVNGDVLLRGRQAGGFVEGGVRLKGGGATMELFLAVERRVDADPLDRLPKQWGLAGFRLVSR